MSPQTRRGRAVPAGQRKTATRPTTAANRKPAAAVAEPEDELDEAIADDVMPSRVRHGRRQRGLGRVRRTSAYKYANELLGAYVPLIVAFVVLFAVVWGYISFGPHTPTPRENWTTIEKQWRPQREADLAKVSAALAANDLQGALKAYAAVSDDTKGWSDALLTVKTWEDPSVTTITTTSASEAVSTFIQGGQVEVMDLAALANATTMNDLLAQKDTLDSDENSLKTDYGLAYLALFGANPPTSPPPTLAFPPGTYVPSPSPGPSASPSPSASVSPSPSASAAPSVGSSAAASPAAS